MFIPLTVKKGKVVSIGISITKIYDRYGREGQIKNEYPIVSFRTGGNPTANDTENIRLTNDENPGSLFAKYNIGDNVNVCFNPKYPEKARLYSFLTYWFSVPTIIIFVFSGVFVFGLNIIIKRGSDY